MKNILNNVIVAFVALALTFATVSCKKNKDDDPKPIQNPVQIHNPTDSSGNGGANTTPIFDSTSATVVSDGSAKTFELPVSNADDYIITSITGGSSNVTVTFSGKSVTVTPVVTTYAGVETLRITIANSVDTITTNFIVNIGSTSQIITYNTLISNNFLNRMLQGTVGNMYINSNGSITSNSNTGFYNSALTSATYTITSSGYLEINAGGNLITYSVQVASGYLVLTDIDTGEIFNEQ